MRSGEPRDKREIESWLGDLRSGGSTPQQPPRPSAQPTVSMGDQGGNAPTTAIPTQRDVDATEKLDTSKVRDAAKDDAGDDAPTRRSGGLSAADLLRREGRL